MKKTIAFFALLILFCFYTKATKIYVPGTYPTIQSAINHAVNGDTIVVSSGVYFENINFNGKNVVLTSNYLFSSDYNDVLTTIIDGSLPVHADTASVVLFINGEDSTAVLNGFTLRNGNGTVWDDEHSSGDYREGGGILTALSAPTITNNFIIYNKATEHTGISGAGGGGIRSGDGNPKIINNVIIFNQGGYGAGIVLNYCGGKVYNNIIAYNHGGESYGGGGIWINGDNANPRIVCNNTIVANHSDQGGGGVRFYSGANTYLKNNIIWANTAYLNSQQIQGNAHVTYNDIEGGFAGIGNIKSYPLFYIDSLFLLTNSPCIDRGDSSVIYNDIENTSNPGNALFPSLGNLRNDMGVFGGPFAKRLVPFGAFDSLNLTSTVNFNKTAPPDSVVFNYITFNTGTKTAYIDSIRFVDNTNNQVVCRTVFPMVMPPLSKDTIILWWKPYQNFSLSATMLVYHKDPKLTNPFSVSLTGVNNTGINEISNSNTNIAIHPNPSEGSVNISFNNALIKPVSIYVLNESSTLIREFENLSVKGNSITFDLNDLKSGVYLMKFVYKNGFAEYLKFIIL